MQKILNIPSKHIEIPTNSLSKPSRSKHDSILKKSRNFSPFTKHLAREYISLWYTTKEIFFFCSKKLKCEKAFLFKLFLPRQQQQWKERNCGCEKQIPTEHNNNCGGESNKRSIFLFNGAYTYSYIIINTVGRYTFERDGEEKDEKQGRKNNANNKKSSGTKKFGSRRFSMGGHWMVSEF